MGTLSIKIGETGRYIDVLESKAQHDQRGVHERPVKVGRLASPFQGTRKRKGKERKTC